MTRVNSSLMENLDPEILREMNEIGVKMNDTGRALSEKEKVIYHLLIDRRSKRSSFTNLLPVQKRNAHLAEVFAPGVTPPLPASAST